MKKRLPTISLEALQSAANGKENPLLTVALVAQYFDEPLEEQMASLLQQVDVRVQLLAINNGTPNFDAGAIAHSIIVNRQPGYGEASSLTSAEVCQTNPTLPYQSIFKQVEEKALGEYVLFLFQDDCFTQPQALTQVASWLHNLPLLQEGPYTGLCLPVATAEKQQASFGGTYLDVPIIPTNQLKALKLEDAYPTLRLAINKAIQQKKGFARLEESLLHRGEPCPVPDVALFSGQCNYTVTHQLVKTTKELLHAANDFKKSYALQALLRDTLDKRLIRSLKGYWGLSTGERYHLRFLGALLSCIDRLLLGATTQKQYTDALGMLLEQFEKVGRPVIRIAFFAQEFSVWPSLQAAYEYCQKDPRFETKLVYVPFSHNGNIVEEEIAPYYRQNLPVIPYNQFDIKEENLDVAVLVKAYDVMPVGYSGQELAAICETLSYIPYHISLFGTHFEANRTALGFDVFYSGQPVQTLTRYFVVDSPGLAAHTAANNLRNGANLLHIGHPRMDLYQGDQKSFPLPEAWQKKIKNRTVFLYNSHHTEEFSTFFDYSEDLFRFFAANPDMALIWRPHPLMKSRFADRNIMSERQWNKLVKKINASRNIIFDDSPEYHTAFYYAHALITDISSLFAEYMFLNRPILLLSRLKDDTNRYQILFSKELLAGAERAFCLEDIKTFLLNTKMGQDNKKEARLQFLKESMYGYGTSVSQSFANFIYEDLTTPYI